MGVLEADVAIEEDERDLREATRVREVETEGGRDEAVLRHVGAENTQKEADRSLDPKTDLEVIALVGSQEAKSDQKAWRSAMTRRVNPLTMTAPMR